MEDNSTKIEGKGKAGPIADIEPSANIPIQHAIDGQIQYPSGLKLFLILLSLYLAVFLLALDRTVIATAIPRITDDFHSLSDIAWYGSAFLLTSCAFMLLFGKIYTFYSTKSVYLAAILLFEIGSLICGAAPSSTAFIVGRAVAGAGSAGEFSGAIVIIVHTSPLEKRPLYQGLFGAVFGLAAVIGPLLGGALTDRSSWRWCFYINLSIGAATIFALIFILQTPTPPTAAGLSVKEQLIRLDPIGNLFFLPSIICLILALQWGGNDYPWNSTRVIVLLVLFSVLFLAFIGIQIHLGDDATVPLRVIKQRSVASGFLLTFCCGASMMVMVYYLPIWFQAIQGVSAVESGIRVLALVLSLVAGSVLAGMITYQSGYYTPAAIVSSVVMSVGAGLLSTWQLDTSSQKWIGYQIIYGIGLGLGFQQAQTGVQTVLAKDDVPMGAALIFFGQTLGGAVFLAVAQNVFSSKLSSGLPTVARFDPRTVLNSGATEFRQFVPEQYLDGVLNAFNVAIQNVIYVSLAMSCLSIVGAVTMEWYSIKNGEAQGQKPKGSEKVAAV